MVFSFFKKQPEKMVARPAVVPRRAEVEGGHAEKDKESKATQPDSNRGEAGGPEMDATAGSLSDFSDFAFSQSSLDFHVEAEVDPVDAQAEEAAVLFANSQDAVAQTVLEGAVQAFRGDSGERLWRMLFDLYRVTGQCSVFETMGIEYARTFEKSPPGWEGSTTKTVRPSPGGVSSLVFKGELLGSNQTGFDAVKQSLGKNRKQRLDMSNVGQLDAEGCACLLQLLLLARKNKQEIELLGREALGELVQGGVEVGRAEGKACWLLLLELCQLQGRQEAFEEVAIDYAVTFEESPPSWEIARVAEPEPEILEEAPVSGEVGDHYVLNGEVKAARFTDLPSFAEGRDAVQIDCSGLRRMDFVSAGALLNALTSVRRSGKKIVFLHPNYLVAELLRIVGLTAVATVVFAKR